MRGWTGLFLLWYIGLPLLSLVGGSGNSKTKLPDDFAGHWTGTREIQSATPALIDSIVFDFHTDGTVTFHHQVSSRNEPTAGIYKVSGKVLTITIYRTPFKHSFQGTVDRKGNVSGVFTSIREHDPSQPRPYSAGSDTGTFTITKS